MYRKTLLVGAIALCAMATAAGCRIYLDDEDSDGPDRPGGIDWPCDSNYDCAGGCYCDPDTDTCQEAGFCNRDSDCPEGYVCDDRSSCVPDGSGDECTADDECPAGSFCDESSGDCIESGDCEEDGDCPDGQTCDEERSTCVPAPCDENSDCPSGSYCDQNSGQCVGGSECGPEGECPEGTTCDTDTDTCVPDLPDPPTCQGEVTCDEQPPVCPEGTNPGIVDGCYIGECVPDAECPDGAPIFCSDHTTEDTCVADQACDPVYRGINCTDPDGRPCSEPGSDCRCEDFDYHSCEDDATPGEPPAPPAP